jgi:hypothetical protein
VDVRLAVQNTVYVVRCHVRVCLWGYPSSRGRRTRIELPVGGHKLSFEY